MTRKILVATTNRGKIAELRALLEGDIRWLGLSDFKQIPEIEEDGQTFTQNARKKALGYAKACGLWTIADDSGLVIDALGGEPGVRSARFSEAVRNVSDSSTAAQRIIGKTKPADKSLIDLQNIQKVLKLMEGVPVEKRTARFVCCICLASPEKVLIETEGVFEGLIAEKAAGENGFGYDPIFFVPNLNKTVAELTSEEKNAISHRGSAIRKFKPLLDQLLS